MCIYVTDKVLLICLRGYQIQNGYFSIKALRMKNHLNEKLFEKLTCLKFQFVVQGQNIS